jgi:hypothetical protein
VRIECNDYRCQDGCVIKRELPSVVDIPRVHRRLLRGCPFEIEKDNTFGSKSGSLLRWITSNTRDGNLTNKKALEVFVGDRIESPKSQELLKYALLQRDNFTRWISSDIEQEELQIRLNRNLGRKGISTLRIKPTAQEYHDFKTTYIDVIRAWKPTNWTDELSPKHIELIFSEQNILDNPDILNVDKLHNPNTRPRHDEPFIRSYLEEKQAPDEIHEIVFDLVPHVRGLSSINLKQKSLQQLASALYSLDSAHDLSRKLATSAVFLSLEYVIWQKISSKDATHQQHKLSQMEKWSRKVCELAFE